MPSVSGTDTQILPETRIQALLSSNEPPDDSELVSIQSVASRTNARLDQLGTEISTLRDRLKQLEDQHRALTEAYNQQKAILSPLRRFPAEVLGEIFAWTVPRATRDSASQSGGRWSLRDSPWVLTHVCREWRAVAIAKQSLWSFIELAYYIHTVHALAYPLPMLETQIARARTLQVHFYGSRAPDEGPQIAALRCLVRHSAQWEELAIYLTPPLVEPLRGARGRIPSLQRLWIEWTESSMATVVETIDCFKIAPSLVDVGTARDCTAMTNVAPIHQLTRYDLTCSWHKHVAMLKLAQNLVEARIHISGQIWSEEIITLPTLLRLHVVDAAVLDFLRTPALEELSLWPSRYPSGRKIVASCLVQSCTLRGLHIGGEFAPLPVHAILLGVPSLIDLKLTIDRLHSPNSLGGLISSLSVGVGNGQQTVAPQLQGIHLAGWIPSDVLSFYGEFRQMAESRWMAQHCALREATLAIGMYTKDEFARMPPVQHEGLKFSLVDGGQAWDLMAGWKFGSTWHR